MASEYLVRINTDYSVCGHRRRANLDTFVRVTSANDRHDLSQVGRSTWSPTLGNATTPRASSKTRVPEFCSRHDESVPTGETTIFRRGNGRSITPKSFKPLRFGYWDRSIPIQEMKQTVPPASLGIRT
jgi:hypothetical protein